MLDINKIIQESVQESLNSDDVKTIVETNEGSTNYVKSDVKSDEEIYEESGFDPLSVSAISSGLGALTFRNHYRALQEVNNQNSKSNIAKKVGIGLGAAGAAGAAGAGSVYAAGKKSLKDAQNKYDDSNIVKRWISGPRPEDDGVKSTMKRGLGYMKNKSDDVKGTMKKGASYVKDKYDEVTD